MAASEPAGAIDLQRTGPGTLAGRYLRSFWQPLHRSMDLLAGRAVPVRVLGEGFTLYRGESGQAHLVAERCAHRGARLNVGWVEGDAIRCFYHGWVYGQDGQCLEQPGEPEPSCHKIAIRAYPTREYLGLVFAYLGDGEPPEFPRYPEFEQQPDMVYARVYARASNLLTHIDNLFDTAHLAFVHRLRQGYRESGPFRGEVVETSWGASTWTVQGDRRASLSHFGMPNILEARHALTNGGRLTMAWLVPIDDFNHFQFMAARAVDAGDLQSMRDDRAWEDEEARRYIDGQTDAVLDSRLSVDEAMSPEWGRANVLIQDNIAQVSQMGEPGFLPDLRAEHLGRADAGPLLLRKLWRRELRAFAEGKPTTAWRHPGSQDW